MMRGQDLLELLLYVGDKLSRPTLANLCADFERSAHKFDLRQAAIRWEKQGLMQKTRTARETVYQLTDRGRRLFERIDDPRKVWARNWDGRWRLFLFDLPSHDVRLRQMLWRWLRGHRFGYLQYSVWISPNAVEALVRTLEWFQENPEQFALLEARKITGVSDAALVQGAWDFAEINSRYERYLKEMRNWHQLTANAKTAAVLASVLREERTAYAHALMMDPLLPRSIWPPSYRGPQAEQQHRQFRQRLRDRFEFLVANRPDV